MDDIQKFELVVIGSGPAGQKGAVCAAKMRKRVAIIDRGRLIGGVCVHTGTIPSKTLREAILQLTGFRERTIYGRDYRFNDRRRGQPSPRRIPLETVERVLG